MSARPDQRPATGAAISRHVPVEEKLKLWVRSGGRCAICNRYLLEDEFTAHAVNLAELAHNVGHKPTAGSPRGEDGLAVALRNLADNLLLLCGDHHSVVDVPPAGVLLVAYIIGQLGSLIPIPGGIGGVDAGLIGTLVLYGVDATDAAVAVIAYRGLLLAIPALVGLPALTVLRRRLRDEAHDIAACAPGEAVEVLGRGTVRRSEPGLRPTG
jgi:hypothetical protein